MRTTLSQESRSAFNLRLERTGVLTEFRRFPVHTVYGGAQLFSAETPAKINNIARQSLATFAANSAAFAEAFELPTELAGEVRLRVENKLACDALEDLRIDFEDGYGVRSSDEEDNHALITARETAKAMASGILPEFFGIRIKALDAITGKRAIRTLDLYLTALLKASAGILPKNICITLPKVGTAAEVSLLSAVLDDFEQTAGIERGKIKVEIMVETARSLIGADGVASLSPIVEAASGRCVAAHFGAYDYLSELGIASSDQTLRHPLCDLARGLMKLSLAGSKVDLSDGATNLMPVPRHRGTNLSLDQFQENTVAVHKAWKLHYDNVRRALAFGFYRGWDLHPAQMVARYAAVYSFFLESAAEASERLRSFIEKGARANLVGNTFDDAATGQGLLNYFRRAVDCGAISEVELEQNTGLAVTDIRSSSFTQIIAAKAQE